ncbi:hypothetical protein TanjilG_00072 [Lupinus angustifolius]|uniref:Uncharacterized protein n=1 Tax=Lupinus angustifolius TaxID=3871 RepID=A0A394D0X4_LUPAN|nr:hypothetical protein TanjilG_00072 [Lupinus angustifolius]
MHSSLLLVLSYSVSERRCQGWPWEISLLALPLFWGMVVPEVLSIFPARDIQVFWPPPDKVDSSSIGFYCVAVLEGDVGLLGNGWYHHSPKGLPQPPTGFVVHVRHSVSFGVVTMMKVGHQIRCLSLSTIVVLVDMKAYGYGSDLKLVKFLSFYAQSWVTRFEVRL